MAGHSAAKNKKWRKDRQSELRSQEHQTARREIELLIRQKREIPKEAFVIAREHSFPKEKVYQIWEKLKNSAVESRSTRALFQAPFGILIYLEGGKNIPADLVKKLQLKSLVLVSLPNYFQPLYSLKINLKGNGNNLEEYLLTYLPNEIWEKTNYDEKKRALISPNKEEITRIKKIIEEEKLELVIEEEKNFWKPLIPCRLIAKEEIDYYHELEKQLASSNFYTNIEK
ncbi:MAG: hypothetical protein MRERV_56c013 [Mycoplasmataceae bacterium RV_VA103A]|nr:MAG: hypothetical protein MRERV_56c013 [Mycoplasmataceae bacterium RV_VA103A]